MEAAVEYFFDDYKSWDLATFRKKQSEEIQIIADGPRMDTSLIVYDALGRKIKTLVNKFQSARVYLIQFDGAGLSSGVYFYRLESGNFVVTKKMLLMR